MPSEKVESFGEQVPMGRAAMPDEITPSCSAKPDAGHAFGLEATSAATLQVGTGGVLGPTHA